MAAFIVVDEIFIAYEVEGTHPRLLIAQLLSLLPDHLENVIRGRQTP